ncbi:MAG: hypothetical protein ILNGONEN_02526 [Syntrophorhabdaceae bacterium]|nr:hypothetical protein [Syntrophorhabdaceae bacterium]
MSTLQTPQTVVTVPVKSIGVSLLLTFFFGPLGMLYSTIWGGVIMLIVSIILGLVTLGLSFFLTWPICMIWGAVAANSYNQKLLAGKVTAG